MGSWPFTRLHFGCGRCIAIAGPHIQVLDAGSGQILHSTRSTSIITCSAVDEKYAYLVTTGDDKKLNVWELTSLELKNSRELPKKATAVQLSQDGQTILVADKFGDIFSYPLNPPPDMPDPATSKAPEPRKRDSVASHENPHGTLVLGHASIITSFLLSPDGRYILTADRDEHIRVSRYPQGYVVERYCLGHELFVSAICLPSFEQSSLVSGGGDPSLHIWDWISGTLKCRIPILDAAMPFVKVKDSKQSWHHGGGDGEARGRKGKRKSRKKGKQTPEQEAGDATPEMQQPGTSSLDADPTSDGTSQDRYTFALAKIETIEFDSERLLVFSAIGASALFYCTYPSQPTDVPSVRHVDFLKPVLDFAIGEDSQILVSLDIAWTPPIGANDPDVKTPITVVTWRDGAFKVRDDASSLVANLNGAGSLEASAVELVSLDLYSALALLPKHPEGPDEDAAGDQDFEMQVDTPDSSQGEGKRQHAKPAGRLKTKQALLRRQELDEGSRSVSGDERETKKPKLGTNE